MCICFADLKRYKFLYWFAFPSINLAGRTLELQCPPNSLVRLYVLLLLCLSVLFLILCSVGLRCGVIIRCAQDEYLCSAEQAAAVAALWRTTNRAMRDGVALLRLQPLAILPLQDARTMQVDPFGAVWDVLVLPQLQWVYCLPRSRCPSPHRQHR